jgi:methylmalonyl-CoA mutase N-terminal domain/subunit
MIMKSNLWARTQEAEYTIQRPLNNVARSVMGGIAAALCGATPSSGMGFPYDEPLGLGHSNEAWQLQRDAARIIQFESGISEVLDPLAGSYYIESLTNQIEKDAWETYNTIETMGGSLAATENGWIQREIARSAYEEQKRVETGEKIMVGANSFQGKEEIEVTTQRAVAHPYDPAKRAEAEQIQIANLKKLKKERDNGEVEKCLDRLGEAAKDENINLMPLILEAVKAYATIGEMSDVLRAVFGEFQPYNI